MTEGPASGIDGIGGIGGGGGGGGGREVPALRRKLSIWSSMQEVEAALTEGKQVAASSSAASGVREGVNGGSLAPSLTPALTPDPRPTPTLGAGSLVRGARALPTLAPRCSRRARRELGLP